MFRSFVFHFQVKLV